MNSLQRKAQSPSQSRMNSALVCETGCKPVPPPAVRTRLNGFHIPACGFHPQGPKPAQACFVPFVAVVETTPRPDAMRLPLVGCISALLYPIRRFKSQQRKAQSPPPWTPSPQPAQAGFVPFVAVVSTAAPRASPQYQRQEYNIRRQDHRPITANQPIPTFA